jgi:hypothetical protein
MFAPTVPESIAVPGDAAATAANLEDSAALFGLSLVGWVILLAAGAILAVTLYLILEPVGRAFSLGMAAFRLGYRWLQPDQPLQRVPGTDRTRW